MRVPFWLRLQHYPQRRLHPGKQVYSSPIQPGGLDMHAETMPQWPVPGEYPTSVARRTMTNELA